MLMNLSVVTTTANVILRFHNTVKGKISLNTSHLSIVINKNKLSEMHQNFRAVKTRLAIKDKHSIVVTIPKPLLERYD